MIYTGHNAAEVAKFTECGARSPQPDGSLNLYGQNNWRSARLQVGEDATRAREEMLAPRQYTEK